MVHEKVGSQRRRCSKAIRVGTWILACALVCGLVPAAAFAQDDLSAEEGEVTESELQQKESHEDDVPSIQDEPVQDSTPDRAPQENAAGQSSEKDAAASLAAPADNADKEVTLEGPDVVQSGTDLTLKVYVDGVEVGPAEDRRFDWYSYNDQTHKWSLLRNLRGNLIESASLTIPAASSGLLGDEMSFYCQVTDQNVVLNPITMEGEDVSPVMKSVVLALQETCVVVADEHETIGILQGHEAKGIKVSADGKTITFTDANIDASKSKNGWAWSAVSIEIPDAVEYRDIVINVVGENSMISDYIVSTGNPDEDTSAGYGLDVNAVGAHEVVIKGGGTLFTKGGDAGCILEGGYGRPQKEDDASYRLEGDTTLTCENDQIGQIELPSALVISRADFEVQDATLNALTNSKRGILGFFYPEDDYGISFGPKAIVKIALNEQVKDTHEQVQKGSVALETVGGTKGLAIDGAEVKIEAKETKDTRLMGIMVERGPINISGGSKVSVDAAFGSKAKCSSFSGILGETLLIEGASTVSVSGTSVASPDNITGMMGINSSGQKRSAQSVFVEPSIAIANNSTVSVDLKTLGAARGMNALTQSDVKDNPPLTCYGRVSISDSQVDIAVQAGDVYESVGVESHVLSISEDASHKVSIAAQGGATNCAAIAANDISAEQRQDYEPGYQSTLWQFGVNTSILTPATFEINRFSFNEYISQGFTIGETVYDPANTVLPAATLTIGQRNPIDPNPTHNSIGGISGSRVVKGKAVSFTAVGAGMDNAAPLAGDARYVPLSWSVNPTGAWSAAPYTASFETKDMAVGPHTLSVTSGKEIYSGTAWEKTVETDVKTVSFELYEQKIPPTGDSTHMLFGIILLGILLSSALIWLSSRRAVLEK